MPKNDSAIFWRLSLHHLWHVSDRERLSQSMFIPMKKIHWQKKYCDEVTMEFVSTTRLWKPYNGGSGGIRIHDQRIKSTPLPWVSRQPKCFRALISKVSFSVNVSIHEKFHLGAILKPFFLSVDLSLHIQYLNNLIM